MPKMLNVRPHPEWEADPVNAGRTVLCEMDPDHPDGQVNINHGDGETEVAYTTGVVEAIGQKRLEVVGQPREVRVTDEQRAERQRKLDQQERAGLERMLQPPAQPTTTGQPTAAQQRAAERDAARNTRE